MKAGLAEQYNATLFTLELDLAFGSGLVMDIFMFQGQMGHSKCICVQVYDI